MRTEHGQTACRTGRARPTRLALGAVAVGAIAVMQLAGAHAALANTFGMPTSYASGAGARSLVARNFDTDNDQDLAIANQNAGTVKILRNTGNGAFVPAGTKTLGPGLVGIAAGRFNTDADADLAVTNSYTNTVTILYGTTGASFTTGPTYSVGASPRLLVVGRFNGDARDDLAVANGNSNDVSVLLGSATGLVPSGTFTVAANGAFQPHGIAAGDFDGDARPDLATANYAPSGATVSILLGTGTGSFAPPRTFPAGPFPIAIAAAQINGGSDPDLVVANFTTAGSVTTLLGGPGASFGPPIVSTVSTANTLDKPSALSAAHFGHGAGVDLAVAMGGPSGNKVVVMCGTNTGAFTVCPPAGVHTRTVGGFPFGLAVARLNAGRL
jgi:hypothetical protein